MINRYQSRGGLQKSNSVIKQWTSQLRDCLPLLLLHLIGIPVLEIICSFPNFFVTIPLTELILLRQHYYVVKVIIRNQTFPMAKITQHFTELSIPTLPLLSLTKIVNHLSLIWPGHICCKAEQSFIFSWASSPSSCHS